MGIVVLIAVAGGVAYKTVARLNTEEGQPKQTLNPNVKSADVVLLCNVSGKATQTSNRQEAVVKQLGMTQISYLFSEKSYGWGVSINGDNPIRYVDTSNDKDIRRVSSTTVGDQLLEISDDFWTKEGYLDKDGTEHGALSIKDKVKINRISGAVEVLQSIEYRYKDGLVSKTVRELNGNCSLATPKF